MATYPSLESAAMHDIPPSQARVVTTCEWKDYGVVLLETNDRAPFEAYLVVCSRTRGGWKVLSGANMSTWTPLLPETETGVFAYWEEGLAGESVRIRYREAETEVPIIDGYFLFCAWDVPIEALGEEPQLIQ
jgi:hypothetical protein